MAAAVEHAVRTIAGDPRRWRLQPGMAAGVDCVVCGAGRSAGRLVPVGRLVEGNGVLVAHDRPCWADVQEGRIA